MEHSSSSIRALRMDALLKWVTIQILGANVLTVWLLIYNLLNFSSISQKAVNNFIIIIIINIIINVHCFSLIFQLESIFQHNVNLTKYVIISLVSDSVFSYMKLFKVNLQDRNITSNGCHMSFLNVWRNYVQQEWVFDKTMWHLFFARLVSLLILLCPL